MALMAHWDGFQSAKTAMRTTWTLEVSVLNAGAASNVPPIPILFIPPCDDSDKNIKKMLILDAFLEPFIRDLQLILVDGIPMHYNYPLELIDRLMTNSSGFVLRCMPMIFTGDHPAQCKFGGWSQAGYGGCRRCKLATQTDVGENVLYGGNRRQMRFPPCKRDIVHTKKGALLSSKATSMAEKKRIRIEYGVSTMTRAWRLHDLCGFCVSRDLVYDTMHVLALCMFKKFCELLQKQYEKIPDLRCKLEEALAEVTQRRPRRFDGRWPNSFFSRLGYFKAEEYTRFVIYCVPHILSELKLSSQSALGAHGILLVEIARLFYLRSRAEGWTKETIELARSLLASWRVRTEEAWGPNSAPLEHVAGNEIDVSIPRPYVFFKKHVYGHRWSCN